MKGFSFELGNQILVSMMGGAILGDFFGTKGSIIGAVIGGVVGGYSAFHTTRKPSARHHAGNSVK